MSPLTGVTNAGQSLQNVWNRIGQQTEELSAQVAAGEIADGSFVQTVVALKALKLQAAAAGMIFKTLNDMADELLTQPRK